MYAAVGAVLAPRALVAVVSWRDPMSIQAWPGMVIAWPSMAWARPGVWRDPEMMTHGWPARRLLLATVLSAPAHYCPRPSTTA